MNDKNSHFCYLFLCAITIQKEIREKDGYKGEQTKEVEEEEKSNVMADKISCNKHYFCTDNKKTWHEYDIYI